MSNPPAAVLLPDQSELVIALVAAVGTDVAMVCDHIATELDRYAYTTTTCRLSRFLEELTGTSFSGLCFDEEVWEAMSAGDELRERWERNDALALQAISDIVATRTELATSEIAEVDGSSLPSHLERHAFLLRSLKTPQELNTLRAVYGPRLIVIAAYSPRDRRLEHLGEQIQRSRKTADRNTWKHSPQELIERDEREERDGGQNVSDTFHRADFFIRAWDTDVAQEDLVRTMEILFGAPFRTPTRDEYGQFMAAGAALRSAEFGRQVGAAIATSGGSIVALGTNEVPVYGGGAHWEDLGRGNRDFEIGDIDTNRRHLDELATQLSDRIDERLERLIEALPESKREDAKKLSADLLEKLPVDLRAGGLKDLTEFGRAVHAEMSAILDAAVRGASVAGATIYSTTFPCHNCARHLIGAGIRRVVFIEPYPKSRTEELHDDTVTVDRSEVDDHHLTFEPFVGVAPRRYQEMFDAEARKRLGHLPRKDGNGKAQVFARHAARPVFVDGGMPEFRPLLHGYRAKETAALGYFDAYSRQDEDPSDGS
jgi:deoxycytidylate deaminase